MPYIQNTLGMIVEVIVGLFLIASILRFLFQLLKADFRNPISQAVFTLTNPPLRFLRKFIPGLFGIDLASVVLILLVSCVKFGSLILISGYGINFPGLIAYSVGKALNTIIWIFIIAIIVRSLMSWLASARSHPMTNLLDDLSEPVIRPFRRFLPSLGGLDLTPILAILALNIVQQLVAYPIINTASRIVIQN